MSTEAADDKTTTENSKTSHKGSTLLGLEVESLAWIAKFALVVGAAILAIVGAFGLRWEDQADERARIREEEYKRTAGKVVEDTKAEAARANEATAELTKETESLRLKVSEQEEATAKANERAARAETELLALQQRFAHRNITKEQSAVIASFLARFKGETVNLHILSGLPEVDRFATQLGATLRSAGITVKEVGIVMSGGLRTGVSIEAGAKRMALGTAIGDVLLSSGVVTEQQLRGQTVSDPDALVVTVWPKE